MMKGMILTFLCVIFSTVLAGQNEIEFQNQALIKVLKKEGISDFSYVSEIDLADSLKQYMQGKFFRIHSKNSQYKYIYTGRVNSCRAGGCSLSNKPVAGGDSEYFDYFILFDEAKTVQLVKVFNYQATHGHEVTAKGWLKQFVGHSGSETLQVGKNIDAISGATISVYALTMDVENKTEMLQSMASLEKNLTIYP